MMPILPIIIIFALSFALYIMLKANTIESLFISVCTIVISMMAFTLVFGLKLSSYIVCGIAFAAFIMAIVKSIKDKRLFSDFKNYINNPALIVFLLVVGIYAFFIHDNHLYTWDDFSHWALAVKAIYVFDGFNITPGILQPQTLGMPVFNAFIVSLSELKQGYMLIGMWIVYWASLLLPISKLKWNNALTIVIYSIIMYSVLIFISHQPRPNLYNDANLAVISGSLAAYLCIKKKFDWSTNALVVSGLMLLPHIKNVVGIIFALFVASIWVYYLWIDIDKTKKAKAKIIGAALVGTAASIIVNIIAKKVAGGGSFSPATQWSDPIGSAINAFLSPVGMLLIATSVAFALLVILGKKEFIRKISLILLIAAIAILIVYIYIKLDDGTKILINAFIKNVSVLKINDVYAYKIVSLFIIAYYAIWRFFIAQTQIKAYRILSLLFAVQAVLYNGTMILAYSKFPYDRAISSSSLDRYMLSFIFYMIISVVAVMLADINFWKSKKEMMLSSLLILGVVVLTISPKPLTLFKYEKDVIYNYTFNYKVDELGKKVISKVDEEEKVYVITQGDSGHISNLFQYSSLPVYTSRENFSLGPPKSNVDAWSVELTKQELAKYIISKGYDYLLILGMDDFFISEYSEMFESPEDIHESELYKIVEIQHDEIKFELVP